MKKAKHLEGVTAGEILLEDFLKPLNINQSTLAKALVIPLRHIHEIILGKRAITLDTSIRLGRFFKQDSLLWLRLQQSCDLRNAQDLVDRITAQIKPFKMPKEMAHA